MVIVTGEFFVESGEREAFIAGRVEAMRASRAEPGCIEYTFGADPLDGTRVVLLERWASQEALDVHLSALRAKPPAADPGVVPKSVSILLYDVTGERSLS